jgi:flagellar biosynthesis anti-sigma factor FlgM
MKISCDHVGRIVAAELRSSQRLSGARKPSARSDEICLSSRAQDIQAARRVLDATPEIRLGRVARLRDQVARGEYQVPSEDIAEAILRDFELQQRLEHS